MPVPDDFLEAAVDLPPTHLVSTLSHSTINPAVMIIGIEGVGEGLQASFLPSTLQSDPG
jgi:hypothetical protein